MNTNKQKHPVQGWDYEEEVKPIEVPVFLESGNTTNLIIDAFRLPEDKIKEWEDKLKEINEDVVKTMLSQDTSVGFAVGQHHIVDILQKSCSQQMILTLAAQTILKNGMRYCEQIIRKHTKSDFEDFLSKLLNG